MQQNIIPNEPDLKDLLNLLKKDIFLNLNCHHVATIQEFNSENQTATATINYTKTFFEPNLAGVYQPVARDYAILADCPVICLGGGLGALTFPIAKGDECLVFFNDRDLDNWFQGSATSQVATSRLHSFADGIILVGLRSLNTKLVNYNGTDIELRTKDGTVKVSVSGEGDYIKAQIGDSITFEVNSDGKFKFTNASGEFLTALYNMLTQAYTVTMLGNQPLVFPAGDLATFTSFKE